MILTTLLAIIIVPILLICLYIRHAFTYWKRRGVSHLEPEIPFGNIKKLIKGRTNFGLMLQDLYKQIKGPYGGFYLAIRPAVLVKDPEIIKKVLLKDFNSFPDRGIFFNEKNDPLSANMFALRGHNWKLLRNKITPTFTSGKMKMMFHTLEAVGRELESCLDSLCDSKKPIDVKDLFARFTTDIIGSCVFGLECNSLKNPKNEFRIFGDEFIKATFTNTSKIVAGFVVPSLLKFFKIKTTDKKCTDFFVNVLEENIKYREENNIHRKDFMDLFIRLKNNENITDEALIVDSEFSDNKSNDGVTFLQLAAQAIVFFIAGYETTSTTSAVCLMELAKNLDIQDKLRKEISDVLKKYNNELTYEAMMEMKYLDQVLNETLRKYPIAPNLARMCREDCELTPDLKVEKDTIVWISVLGIHNDSKYYPNPEKFDPERFSEESKANRPPFVYMPFGEGPRNCIGARFALMQSKMALIAVLRNHRFNTVSETKIEWTERGILLFPKDQILLKPERTSA